LDAGHQVTAYVRNPKKITPQRENLDVLVGEITDAAKVAEVIAGADAVISVLGAVRGGSKDLMKIAAKNIVAGMKQKKVNRLLFATGAGVRAPEDVPVGMHKLIGGLMRLVARDVLEESLRGTEIVKTSGLDWTIVRGPMLQDAPYNGNYRVGFVGKEMGRTLARGNFAHFLLEQVDKKTWVGKMPALCDK
jgi:putative NADH-flavin reductase